MIIMGIDPGPRESGWVVYNPGQAVREMGIDPNLSVYQFILFSRGGREIDEILLNYNADRYIEERRAAYNESVCRARVCVIEKIESYGMPVGESVFETVRWADRFAQAFGGIKHRNVVHLPRREVKLHLCNSMRGKDANVRQSLLNRFPRTGGGKTPQIGTKAKPGPLYGVKSHIWSALALAVTYYGMQNQGKGEKNGQE